MKFEIQAPDNVIEASYSAEPDDVSVVSIRIVATRVPLTGDPVEHVGDPTQIRFTLDENLTLNPTSVTPQAFSFRDWQMQAEGGRTFVATRRSDPAADPEGSELEPPEGGWTFFLRDVEVAQGAGEATIEVAEKWVTGTTSTQILTLRKVHPRLRIDYFHAIASSSVEGVNPSLDEPLRGAVTTSDVPVRLSWATTAAERVSLYGPHIEDIAERGGAVSDDDSVEVSPETTSVYTLVASNATAHTVAQVTVTVTDQSVVANLIAPGPELGLISKERAQQERLEGLMQANMINTGFALLGNDSNGQRALLKMHEHHGLEGGEDLTFRLRPRGTRFVDGEPVQERQRYDLTIQYSGESMGAVLSHDGEWYSSSDASLKEGIKALPPVLDQVRRLRPSLFAWKGETTENVGLIAQDVEKVFPHLVETMKGSDGEDELSLAYSRVGVLAVAAIQELADQSEARIDALERTVAELTSRLDATSADGSATP